ncbi:(2Fe-2S)-binding protein [Actinomadura rupiterrae]|uniref:(2Fe-2S)-binding protein n=1 Tax=Actinomadura rupiterrae TaxID=559627 RepID=UPI0020A26F5B|nr:2Fe-2S iron-sulfur cluster-binding protein [Actinomadura rupiterrae]MCP2334697.1 xanthine dehydrogenase YagT iron-sulfur-binding subunit [Actinomadura rupiterrae]
MTEKAQVRIGVNGRAYRVEVDTRTSLLDLLREGLDLTGTKKGCDHGQCGACTVLLDGRRVNACLVLAVAADGSEVTTVEGLASGDELSPIQSAFVECDAFQCGYCTPGQLCSAVGMLDEAKSGWPSAITDDLAESPVPELSAREIRERMSGNLCRCGAYVNIVEAVRRVAK